MSSSDKIIRARKALGEIAPDLHRSPDAAEGGCGVLGLASRTRVAGRHVLSASRQMHNRGNGKGGGIAMAGLDPEQVGVDEATLDTHYLIQIAYLDSSVREEVEEQYLIPSLDIFTAYELPHVDDYLSVEGLDVRPPDVWRYVARVKPDVLKDFASQKDLENLPDRDIEDEFIYQNSFEINTAHYASLGEKRAFVLSHGRDLSILKIVGYAEQVVEYYMLENQSANIWIAHQRYPTKGRVWHPGGAHPFIGLNEALVHNGDFANYHAVGEYLLQRNMYPLFLTDTEVGVQLFDLFDRVYKYPLEITLEAMAPTTEHDFVMLPDRTQHVYEEVQAAHLHASPDGPWFFIVARSKPDDDRRELIGITDTSMLRPQVFALYENMSPADGEPVQIGLIASERQAINACLRSLSGEDVRFQPTADRYWAARGGSHTDGGSFSFSISKKRGLICTNKFGTPVTVNREQEQLDPDHFDPAEASSEFRTMWNTSMLTAYDDGGASTMFEAIHDSLSEMGWNELGWGLEAIEEIATKGSGEWRFAREMLNYLRDRSYNTGHKKRASVNRLVDSSLKTVFDSVPLPASEGTRRELSINWTTRSMFESPGVDDAILVMDVSSFPAEGVESAARWITKAHDAGWKHIIAHGWHGGRFAGAGLGPNSEGLTLELYGDVGDYAGSGVSGATLIIHNSAQDQVAQIMRSGKLVIHGDVGQTFMYGAKGGEIYVKGSAAGRPLINAVGKPRTVINGTCLDYLAESFMAGDPLKGGGFVIINGIMFADDGSIVELDSPYPGGNLFSLASGGAVYLRDPHHKVDRDQLNGGTFEELTGADWELIKPYLQENERLFGIAVDDLLTVDGSQLEPADVYRKVMVSEANAVLTETENR